MGGQPSRRALPQSARGSRRRTRPAHRERRPLNAFGALACGARTHLGRSHRYAHSVRVARLADRLAQRHGEDPRRARTAGLLHDIARLERADALVGGCRARDLPIGAFEARNPIVLHAPLGAALARERFGIEDPAVLSAIAKHTVAAAEMSRLDAIVFLADGLEPGRAFAEREELEWLAFRDIDAAMLALLRSTLAYLAGRGLEAAPTLVTALATYAGRERSSLPA